MSRILSVPYLDQSKAAPTGCESVTAVMLLNYLGIDMSIREFVDEHLPKGDFHTENGVLYGPSPYDCFVGDPYSTDAMGCYAPVIRSVLQDILGAGYTVTDETGRDVESLVSEYIDGEGMPVVLWATIDLKPAIEGPYWKLDGSGEDFTWWSNEHCMLLTGYDGADYIFNDPWNNNGVIRYDRELVKKRHAEQHMQAVGVKKNK